MKIVTNVLVVRGSDTGAVFGDRDMVAGVLCDLFKDTPYLN